MRVDQLSPIFLLEDSMKRLVACVCVVLFLILSTCAVVFAEPLVTVNVEAPEVSSVGQLLSIKITDLLTPPDVENPCGGINSVIMHYPDPVDDVALGIDQIQIGGSWAPSPGYKPGSVLYIDETYDFTPDVPGTYEFQINTLALCDIPGNPLFAGVEIRKVVLVQ